MNTTKFIVVVSRRGFGAYTGGAYETVARFHEEKKARDYYTDMLVRYPDAEVTIIKQ